MSFTETTRTSWFGRMRNALVGILFGFLLLFGSIWLLIWNEGRAIQTYRALAEGASTVISVSGDALDAANDGKLIHIVGPVTVDGLARDDIFGIQAENAVGITRQVEMYQWVQKSESTSEKKLGGAEETTTTYSYVKEWHSGRVNSNEFKQPDGHDNPENMPEDQIFVVDAAHVGAFTVPAQMVADVGERSDIALTDADAGQVSAALGSSQKVTRTGHDLYVGQSSAAPQVGDLRIGYQRIDAKQASFVGKQKDDAIVAYVTTNGREIFLSALGNSEATDMFKSAQDENNIITWLVRLGGLVAMFIGFVCIFSIFGVVGDIIPFIGSIVSFGTTLIAMVLTVLLGAIVIAIGWIAYRPIIAIAIIALAAVIAFGVVKMRRKTVAAAPAA